MADLRILRVGGTGTVDTDLRILRIGGTASADANLRVLRIGGTGTAVAVANAGADQTVDAFQSVTLSGALSQGASSYAWSQVSGSPTVALTGASTSTATFTAPATVDGTTLVFRLTCGSSTDDVSVTVRCHNRWVKTASGWAAARRVIA